MTIQKCIILQYSVPDFAKILQYSNLKVRMEISMAPVQGWEENSWSI